MTSVSLYVFRIAYWGRAPRARLCLDPFEVATEQEPRVSVALESPNS